jgi:hypothetical protein
MAGNDSLNDRKTHSRAGELLRSVQSLKDAKQSVSVAHIETRTVVLDLVQGFGRLDTATDLDARRGSFGAIF